MTAPSPFAIAAAHYAERCAQQQWDTPGEMAKALDPSTIQTPALDLIDAKLVEVAEGRCKRLLISMSPQEGKSQRTSRRFPLWVLLGNLECRIAIGSYSHSRARTWGRVIRNDIWSHGSKLGLKMAPDSQAADDWELAGHVGGVYCTGVGGALTGRPVDLMIIDDPVKDRQQADSQTYRDNVWSWWTDVVLTRLAPGAPVVVIMTRWHEDDLAGRLLAEEDGDEWDVINIPALADHRPEKGETDPLGRAPGEWMISTRGRTVADWESKRIAVGTRTFTSLYQGRPSPESGDVWLREWWQNRYVRPLWLVHHIDGSYYVPDDPTPRMIQSWDMAFKATKDSDYVVGQVWYQQGPRTYLLDQIRKRLTFTETVAAVRDMSVKWPQASLKVVEDKANGTAVLDTLKAEIPGLVGESPTDSKYGRALAVAPFIEAGNVFLPDKDIALFDVDALIDEAAAFPNGKHDDQVDATSQALARLMTSARSTQGAVAKFSLYAEEPRQAANW